MILLLHKILFTLMHQFQIYQKSTILIIIILHYKTLLFKIIRVIII
jgi:hypothetical protein